VSGSDQILILSSSNHTDKNENKIFPHIQGNSDGIGCKVIYEEGLPKI
jgi:hypothetical protein